MKRTHDSTSPPIITETDAKIQEVSKELGELWSDPPILKTRSTSSLSWPRAS